MFYTLFKLRFNSQDFRHAFKHVFGSLLKPHFLSTCELITKKSEHSECLVCQFNTVTDVEYIFISVFVHSLNKYFILYSNVGAFLF